MFITTENLFAEKSYIDKTDLEKKIEERKKTRGIEDTDKIHYESESTDKSKQAQELLKAVTGNYTPEEVRHLLKTDIESLQRKIDDLESALKDKRLKNKEKKLIKKEISETQYKLSEAKSKLHEANKKMAEAVKGAYPSMSSSIAKHSVTFSHGGAEGSMSWKILQKQKSEAKLILEDLQNMQKIELDSLDATFKLHLLRICDFAEKHELVADDVLKQLYIKLGTIKNLLAQEFQDIRNILGSTDKGGDAENRQNYILKYLKFFIQLDPEIRNKVYHYEAQALLKENPKAKKAFLDNLNFEKNDLKDQLEFLLGQHPNLAISRNQKAERTAGLTKLGKTIKILDKEIKEIKEEIIRVKEKITIIEITASESKFKDAAKKALKLKRATSKIPTVTETVPDIPFYSSDIPKKLGTY